MEHEKARLRVSVKPALLRWARERAGLAISEVTKRFPHYEQWEQGVTQPTLKQLEQLAQVLHVPIGYLFLNTPPEEPLPIPDFRSLPGRPARPSPDLLDTIYLCQQRQAWYRDFLTREGSRPLPFIRSATIAQRPVEVAANIRRLLRFDVEERSQIPTWSQALRRFIEQVEAAGILVMASGVVGNNPHRKLDVQEFRGFTLVDELAPLIFINGADTKAGQMFTLAHELAHLWLGSGGVSNVQLRTFPDSEIEQWCNQVATELLVPLAEFRRIYRPGEPRRSALDRLARHFKVSTLVILRRMAEAGVISRDDFWQAYEEELEHLQQFERQGEGGGNFYHTLPLRVSRTFAQAVLISTLEGQTLFREAYQILGIRKHATFQKLAETLGGR
ncbi:MAG TPA: DNA-binding protein [Chloroflexi bacterium]|nr:DNA-binding protein [Chloroflexota bacterium]HHW88936.1 ImmA/IrrE family metallo-endopeptidase [Chloroflexota bacterium]